MKQNRSILGWVKPGAEFSFDVEVQNLSQVELGALLWLLELKDDCFLRFGGGKPLGFGSVRLEIDSLELRTGNDLRARYSAWHEHATPPDEATARNDSCSAAKNAFRDAVVRAYPVAASRFDDVPFIRAFLTACRGHQDNLPVHYPRATADGQPGPASPDGESFKWFVANERDGARHALGDLASDRGLPTLLERPGGARPPGQGAGPRGGRAHGGGRRRR